MKPDVSIMIVHYNTPGLLRQTLKGIRRAAPTIRYEVIVVDNNPKARISSLVKSEFPEVTILESEVNCGFGRGMNIAMDEARGRYLLVFNPDMIIRPKSLETLVAFLDKEKDVGIVAPQLKNPNGSVQHSCYRFMEPKTILYRRLPLVKKLSFVKEHLNHYLMEDWDHQSINNVDYALGAALCIRRDALREVGVFDPNLFMYFEDQDLCRRFWDAGWRVVYHPEAQMVHYHRRETAEGNFLSQIFHPLTRIQMKSAVYYYQKHGWFKDKKPT